MCLGFPFGGDALLVETAPGAYQVTFGPIQTDPSEQEPFVPGTYEVQAGECLLFLFLVSYKKKKEKKANGDLSC